MRQSWNTGRQIKLGQGIARNPGRSLNWGQFAPPPPFAKRLSRTENGIASLPKSLTNPCNQYSMLANKLP
jgi:hypothetical protein